MEQQDYLKRQIERIGMILGGLIGRLLGRTPMTGTSAVQEVYDELKKELSTKPQEAYATIDLMFV